MATLLITPPITTHEPPSIDLQLEPLGTKAINTTMATLLIALPTHAPDPLRSAGALIIRRFRGFLIITTV